MVLQVLLRVYYPVDIVEYYCNKSSVIFSKAYLHNTVFNMDE